jgi:hypothetical protein
MTSRVRFGRATLAALLAGSVLVACDTKLTEVTGLVGPRAFDFSVGPAAAGLPSGTATVGAGSVTLSLSGLRALAGGQYQFWVMGRDLLNRDVAVQGFGTIVELFQRVDTLADGSPNINPITGDTIYVGDSRTVSDIRVAGYAGSPDPFTTSARVILDSTADLSNPATYNAVFVTVEPAPATSPGPARFLWRRIGVGGSGAMLFGNFAGSDPVNLQSPLDYVFAARGAGTGGARGPEVSVDFREIARPPVGFFYRGYIVNKIGDGVVVDTLRSAWSRESSVSRVSLYDADVDGALPEVVGDDIRASQVRNCASGSNVTNCQNTMVLPPDSTFAGYEAFQLKLEPKGGVPGIRNKSVVHSGPLPKQVK